MRKLALAMPEAEERSHFGQPDFRVRGKIFAGVSPEGDRATLKLTPELQAMALDGNPRAFFPAAGAWGRKGWTHVRLPEADPGEVAPLIAEAWRLTAPRRLLAAYDAAPPNNKQPPVPAPTRSDRPRPRPRGRG